MSHQNPSSAAALPSSKHMMSNLAELVGIPDDEAADVQTLLVICGNATTYEHGLIEKLVALKRQALNRARTPPAAPRMTNRTKRCTSVIEPEVTNQNSMGDSDSDTEDGASVLAVNWNAANWDPARAGAPEHTRHAAPEAVSVPLGPTPFVEYDIGWVKMQGYPWWPAQISSVFESEEGETHWRAVFFEEQPTHIDVSDPETMKYAICHEAKFTSAWAQSMTERQFIDAKAESQKIFHETRASTKPHIRAQWLRSVVLMEDFCLQSSTGTGTSPSDGEYSYGSDGESSSSSACRFRRDSDNTSMGGFITDDEE